MRLNHIALAQARAIPLRWALVLLLMAVLIPGLAFTAVSLNSYAQSERSRYEIEAIDTARLTAAILDRDLTGLLTTLQSLAVSQSLASNDLAAFHNRATMVKSFIDVDVVLRTMDGQQVVNTRQPFGSVLPISRLIVDAEAIRTGKPVISGVFTGAIVTRPLYTIVVPVFLGSDNTLTYLLSLSASADRLPALLREALPQGWVIGVGDRAGIYLARSERNDEFSGKPGLPEFLKRAQGKQGAFRGSDPQGFDILAGYVRSSLSGWLVAASVPVAVIEAPFRQQIFLLLGFGTASLAFSMLLAYWLGRKVSVPLQELAIAGQSITRGKAYPKVRSAIKEIVDLDQALAASATSLRSRAAERDEAYGRLSESEARQRLVLESARDYAIISTDLNGQITGWNLGAENVFGWTREEAAHQAIDIIFTPEDQKNARPTVERQLALTDGRASDERPHVRRDGAQFWASGELLPMRENDRDAIGFVKIVRDRTKERAAAEQIKSTAERMRLAAKATNDAIWDWDLTTNHVLWNEALEKVFGYAPMLVGPTGDWWMDQLHPDDRQRVEKSIHAVIDSADQVSWTSEYRFRRADKTYAEVLDRGFVSRDENGRARRMIGAILDLTERKNAEKALQELNEDLERRVVERTSDLESTNRVLVQEIENREKAETLVRQLQKMEAVGQLTGGVAHDFNNMLAVIIGSMNLLSKRLERGDRDVSKFVDAALDGATRAATLTQRLLAFSRQQPLSPEPLDANKLVAGMSDLLRRTLGAGIKLETVLAGGLWRTLADGSQLENAVLNLAVNARDAMPGGEEGGIGKLTIETANCHLDDVYARRENIQPGQYVMVAVSDTGQGMPNDVVEKAFEPFFTTKEVGKGTGLGLSQVYGFVRQTGGHVKIYSEPHQGTTVKIYLPRLLNEQASSTLPRSDDEAAATLNSGDPRQIILVVEDEHDLRLISAEGLRELGYTVRHAESGEAALRMLESQPDVSLLFTDIVMPEMNGRRLATEALRRNPALKVLFTTGFTRNAVVHNGVLDAGTQLLPKPFTLNQLAVKVREVLQS